MDRGYNIKYETRERLKDKKNTRNKESRYGGNTIVQSEI